MRTRYVTLARVETDEGIVGWGECISQWPESAVATGVVIEPNESPMQHELVTNPFEQADGFVEVRDEPGLGVEFDQDAVRRYPFG